MKARSLYPNHLSCGYVEFDTWSTMTGDLESQFFFFGELVKIVTIKQRIDIS